MFARVLFPTDFSAYANAVFACLPELKNAGLREVILLYVIRTWDVPLPETINRESLERVRWSVEEQLNIARMALEGQGLRVRTRIEYGQQAANIVRVAEEEYASLIVMGAQGKTVAQELLLGSVANEVMRRTSIPVLIQKFEVVREMGHIACKRFCDKMFSRVLFPTDFSDCAKQAFQMIKQLKHAGTREVTLLHVQDEQMLRERPPEQVAEFERRDEQEIQQLVQACQLYGLEARALLRKGHPVQEILRVSDEIEPCLIVVGLHGNGSWRRLFAGSVSENVARLARDPVLVVPCQPVEA